MPSTCTPSWAYTRAKSSSTWFTDAKRPNRAPSSGTLFGKGGPSRRALRREGWEGAGWSGYAMPKACLAAMRENVAVRPALMPVKLLG